MSSLMSDIAKGLRVAKRKAQFEPREEELEHEELGKEAAVEEDPKIELLNTIYSALEECRSTEGLQALEDLTRDIGLVEEVAYECEAEKIDEGKDDIEELEGEL